MPIKTGRRLLTPRAIDQRAPSTGERDSAARGKALGAVAHQIETFSIWTEPMLISGQGALQKENHPIRQARMQAVVNPLAFPAIFKQTAITQLREVTGDLRLAFIQRTGQLTDTQFFLSGDKQHHPDTSFVSQAFEHGGWSKVIGLSA